MSTIANDPFANVAGARRGAAAGSTTTDDAAERFLKLLVTQMQNQDPLNPMDNAQITTQIAQINTVSGIDKLNKTMGEMATRFSQQTLMQGASLVGKQVSLQGDRLDFSDGAGIGGFDLAGTADRVRVEILSGAGRVIDTIDMGALDYGRHGFEYSGAAAAEAKNFRVVATNGGTQIGSVPLMRDRVVAVSTIGDRLALQTRSSGEVWYSDVKAFN